MFLSTVSPPRIRTLARGRLIGTAALAALVLSGCAAPATDPGDAPGEPHITSELAGELTIFAAASLTAAFTELADEFQAANPGVTVAPISFDGSATLATQLQEGAPADVFASADEANMESVADLVHSPEIFAINTLQLAVAPGNPLGLTGLADLADPQLQVVLCAPLVPCGAASHRLLNLDGVSVTPVSEEQNVTAVLTKVQAGEADAGLVYVTDVTAADGSVGGVDLEGAERAANSYPIAALREAGNPDAARAFVDFVLSNAGREILAGYGFQSP